MSFSSSVANIEAAVPKMPMTVTHRNRTLIFNLPSTNGLKGAALSVSPSVKDTLVVPHAILQVGRRYFDGVTMSTVGDNHLHRIGIHSRHYEPPVDFGPVDPTLEYPRLSPSDGVITPVLHLPRAGDMSNNFLHSVDPIGQYYPFLPTTSFQRPLVPHPAAPFNRFRPDVGFLGNSYSPPTPPSSSGGDSQPVSPTETWNQTHVAALFDQPLVFTVPLTSVEFPSNPGDEDLHFFQCQWKECGVWITSGKEALPSRSSEGQHGHRDTLPVVQLFHAAANRKPAQASRGPSVPAVEMFRLHEGVHAARQRIQSFPSSGSMQVSSCCQRAEHHGLQR
ncbi:hypothetical protein BU15DRAFT_69181 [Melanogaster broomeanus]|nr:hypothetical protein BU15DRAFT_69181 [Melanogaster broomeanus]